MDYNALANSILTKGMTQDTLKDTIAMVWDSPRTPTLDDAYALVSEYSQTEAEGIPSVWSSLNEGEE